MCGKCEVAAVVIFQNIYLAFPAALQNTSVLLQRPVWEERFVYALSEDIRYMYPNCSQIAFCGFFFPVCHSLASHLGRYSSTSPPFQAATLAAFTYMQAQLATATRTISNMQAEINTLKEHRFFKCLDWTQVKTMRPFILSMDMCSRCYTMMKKSLKIQNVKMIKNTSQRSVSLILGLSFWNLWCVHTL